MEILGQWGLSVVASLAIGTVLAVAVHGLMTWREAVVYIRMSKSGQLCGNCGHPALLVSGRCKYCGVEQGD